METNISLDRIVQRAKDVMTFNTRTYEEITRDPSATPEAGIVVATVAIASGLGWLLQGPGALIGGVVAMLLGWVLSAAIIYFVGTRITSTPHTSSSVERVMRIVGYAAVPNVFQFVTGIWLIGDIIGSVLWLWTLATMIVAIKVALNMDTGRAVATGLVAWIGSIITFAIFGAIFNISLNVPF